MNLFTKVLTIGAISSRSVQVLPPQQTTPSTIANNNSFTNDTPIPGWKNVAGVWKNTYLNITTTTQLTPSDIYNGYKNEVIFLQNDANATEAEHVAVEDQSAAFKSKELSQETISDIQTKSFTALDTYIPWGHKSSAVMWYLMSWVEFSSKKRKAITTYLSLPRGKGRQSAYEKVLELYDMSKRNEFIDPQDIERYPTLYGMNREL